MSKDSVTQLSGRTADNFKNLTQKPVRTLLFFLGWLILFYLALLTTVGKDMATKYLSAGKPYAGILASINSLPLHPPKECKRIFYFGDSTLAMLQKEEAPPAILQNILQEQYGENSVEVIKWAFSGASMFHYYCLMHKTRQYSPSLIIIPINYRTFGSLWEKQTRNNKEKKIINRELIAFAPLLVDSTNNSQNMESIEGIKVWDKAREKFNFLQVYYFLGIKFWAKDAFSRTLFQSSPILTQIRDADLKAQKDFEQLVDGAKKTKMTRELFSTIFPSDFAKDSVQFNSFIALAEALKQSGIPFIFYFSPLNFKEMETYGSFNRDTFPEVLQLFRQVVVSNGGTFIDMSELLSEDDFFLWEHYDKEGSRQVAERLAPEVEDILKLKADSRR